MAHVQEAVAEIHFPLNDFQRLMLYWNEQLPFHVVDIVEIAGSVDVATLQQAAENELLATGIATPFVDTSRGLCSYRAEPCQVEVSSIHAPAGTPASKALEQHATSELRRPFRLNVDPLVRLWILDQADNSFVGMTWQHWMGDGMAAGALLRRILGRAQGWSGGAADLLDDWRPVDEKAAFARWFTWRRKLQHLSDTLFTIGTSSQVAQLHRADGELPPPNIHFLDLPEDALARLHRVGKPMGATVNDVLVAVAAKALAAALPRSARSWWEMCLRIGNIVDLRPSGGEALVNRGGMFLGLYNVDCPPDPPARWDDLIEHVRRWTQHSKDQRTYMATLGGFRLLRRLWPWVPVSWRRPVYSNILRLTGVLTNLRYPDPWYQDAPVVAAWRAAPMGFMYPLVLAITTLGARLTMTMSCDATGPIADQADTIKTKIQDTIAGWQ